MSKSVAIPPAPKTLALILGSASLPLCAQWDHLSAIETIYGLTSGHLWQGQLDGVGPNRVLVLPRHGVPNGVAPHRINYRANIQGLVDQGVSHVIALHTVGAIDPTLPAGALAAPDQIIDYSYGREHSFYSDTPVEHIEFGRPFSEVVRSTLLQCAGQAQMPSVRDGGVYACTQGPRLETEAEIRRLANDGCSLVGMTAMPEAALAKERGLEYASLSIVVNPAAGVSDEPIDIDEVHEVGRRSAPGVQRLLLASLQRLVEFG